jgi:hypothetical protein
VRPKQASDLFHRVAAMDLHEPVIRTAFAHGHTAVIQWPHGQLPA